MEEIFAEEIFVNRVFEMNFAEEIFAN